MFILLPRASESGELFRRCFVLFCVQFEAVRTRLACNFLHLFSLSLSLRLTLLMMQRLLAMSSLLKFITVHVRKVIKSKFYREKISFFMAKYKERF